MNFTARRIDTRDIAKAAPKLRAGDRVAFGAVYTARDAAHKRFEALSDR